MAVCSLRRTIRVQFCRDEGVEIGNMASGLGFTDAHATGRAFKKQVVAIDAMNLVYSHNAKCHALLT